MYILLSSGADRGGQSGRDSGRFQQRQPLFGLIRFDGTTAQALDLDLLSWRQSQQAWMNVRLEVLSQPLNSIILDDLEASHNLYVLNN